MTRIPSLKVIERNEPILEKIQELKAEHPFWGYRRVWAHLTYVSKLQVNKKRVYRLMKIHGLSVTKNTRLKAKRTAKPLETACGCSESTVGYRHDQVQDSRGVELSYCCLGLV